MAANVLKAGQRWLGKKRRGKRFQSFRRDALVGNPGDPLIGFPIIVDCRELETENRKLLSREKSCLRRGTSLLADRGQSS
jgi:hypothetical protein